MRIFQTFLLSLIAASLLPGHPMGNFSVNHYARFDFSPRSVKLTYILDLAEIPTLELMQQLKLENAKDPHVTARVATQAREWVKNLQLSENGAAVRPHIESIASRMLDGAAGMQVMRVVMTADLPARPGSLRYEDRNYPGRAGWKEIVITGSDGVALQNPAQGREDRSHALEVYPSDATVAPPQDLSAVVSWSAPAAPQAERRLQPGQQISPAGEAPPPAVAPQRPFAPQDQPAGTVVQGDYLSRMLKNTEITWGMAAIGVLFAFCLGAMHALSPGHGKTIVAAYLVGTRGTLKHAMFLGGMVTFTHTVSVFALGLGVLLFQQYVVPERIIPVLGAISGISIVCIGGYLLYQRAKLLADGAGEHHHHHDHHVHEDHVHAHDHEHDAVHAHSHGHEHAHAHTHDHPHTHAHEHENAQHHHGPDGKAHSHVHSHGGKPHSHVPEGKVTIGSLIALGASGGLVPCPSALVLLLSAIALGRTALGLILLVGFSAGLAVVLMAIGALVIYAKHLLPEGRFRKSPAFRYVPVFSAVVVIVVGLLMTGVSLGWIHPSRMIG